MKKTKEQQKDQRLRKTYGITLDEWKELSKNGCEVCGRKDGRLCVDHIHVLGFKKMSAEDKRKYIRGAACFMCNTGFKAFEKTKDGKRNRQQLDGTYRYFLKYALKGEL